MNFKKQLLLVALSFGASILLMAGGVSADGNTIAGSAKSQTLGSTATRVLMANLDGESACATIVNRSEKTAVIELTVADDAAGTATAQIAKSKSLALCDQNLDEVSVECLGPNKCAFTWDVSKF